MNWLPSVTHKTVSRHNGKDIVLYRITDNSGAYVEMLNYGATLVSVVVPSRDGKWENIVFNHCDNNTCPCGNDCISLFTL